MNAILEISMYPLKDNYIPAIDDFIAELNIPEGFAVQTTATCTIVQGDYTRLMALLTSAIEVSHERYGKSVFTVKIIPDYEPDSLVL